MPAAPMAEQVAGDRLQVPLVRVLEHEHAAGADDRAIGFVVTFGIFKAMSGVYEQEIEWGGRCRSLGTS